VSQLVRVAHPVVQTGWVAEQQEADIMRLLLFSNVPHHTHDEILLLLKQPGQDLAVHPAVIAAEFVVEHVKWTSTSALR
jgi:hypothetical protein